MNRSCTGTWELFCGNVCPGGEGRNLQFADTLVNYDLPWNPMKIKHRIGRVHRIGQTQDVFVFNLWLRSSDEQQLEQSFEAFGDSLQLLLEAEGFIRRMESRLDRDRKRLHEYYGALKREAGHTKRRTAAPPSPEEIADRR